MATLFNVFNELYNLQHCVAFFNYVIELFGA